MKNFPSEYLYVNENGDTFYKRYAEKKEARKVNAYTLASTAVVFSKKATVRTIFKLIEKNDYLKPFLFYFDAFNAEIDKPKQFNLNGAIRFQWDEIDLNDNYFKTNFPKMEVDGIDKNDEPFGLEFLSCNEIADLPLYFDNEFFIKDNGKVLKDIYMHPTLFQVIYGLFWELSFFGNPEQRDSEGKKILEEMKKIKESD